MDFDARPTVCAQNDDWDMLLVDFIKVTKISNSFGVMLHCVLVDTRGLV